MAMVRDFQSFAGPSDRDLRMTELEGYQPISRVGEVVMNAFSTRFALAHYKHAHHHSSCLITESASLFLLFAVDSYDWATLPESVTGTQLAADYENMGVDGAAANPDQSFEHRPAFYEWATVLPGMICLHKNKKTHSNYNYAADTAASVIACAACKTKADEEKYSFAGVARSKTLPPPDDGMGASHDEMFTIALAGMVTVLNTSGAAIHAGEMLGWTFAGRDMRGGNLAKRQRKGPRRIAIVPINGYSDKVIGRALSFAKSGEPVDILLRP